MKIGLALEGLLVDIEQAFDTWKKRTRGQASSYLESHVLNDESFWAALKPCDDIAQIAEDSKYNNIYLLTERPKKLQLVTRSWSRRYGLEVKEEHIVYSSSASLKRYDARLIGLDYYLDSNVEVLESFRYDYTIPVYVGPQTNIQPWIQRHETVSDALLDLNFDIREEFIWPRA